MFKKLTEESLSDNPIGKVIVESEQSWINSVLAIGGFFGPFAAGFLADRRGRKLTLLLSAMVHVVGWIVLLTAYSAAMMIAARIVLGFGSGCILVTLPMYVGEIASDQYRGILGSFLQIGQTGKVFFKEKSNELSINGHLHFQLASCTFTASVRTWDTTPSSGSAVQCRYSS